MRTTDVRFCEFCREAGMTILRQLQVGTGGDVGPSSVFLVLDADGIVKVFKELFEDEPKIYERLGNISRIPRYYGVTNVDESLYFIRLGMCYGQPLTDFIDPERPLGVPEAATIVGQLAETLATMHEKQVLYLDIRPENMVIDGQEVLLVDLGDARIVTDVKEEVPTHIHDLGYVPPETAERGVASAASDVYQLGKLFTRLVGSCELPSIVRQMLEIDPRARPHAAVVAEALRPMGIIISHRKRKSISENNGTVIFPARMGVPHRGHIDFMVRILEMGFRLLVSLQESYKQTEDDPIPKWLVQKMVARSLEKKGFDPREITFLCTPFFATAEQHRLHFAMMPWIEDVVAVATGNESVPELFGDRFPIIDQRVAFGHEEEVYNTRSWGSVLRAAIRADDRETFASLIAPGAEDILTFEEMRAYCLSPPRLYVAGHLEWGRVFVVLHDTDGPVLHRARVSAYSTPESTICAMFDNVKILNPTAIDTVLDINNKRYSLRYERAELDGEKNLLIHYRLIPSS